MPEAEHWLPLREPMTWKWTPDVLIDYAKGDAARWCIRQEAPPASMRWLGEEPRKTRRTAA